jgi:predicted nucleic acid-binding protein
MTLVLDASMALAWCITRNNPSEAAIAQDALNFVRLNSVHVPALWYAEVANALLVFERAKRLSAQDSTNFLRDLETLWTAEDPTSAARNQPRVLAEARRYSLTAYDSTYLELALRKNATLATFDHELAEACRKAGVPVFGDQP